MKILIVTSENDQSTSDVMEWLYFYNKVIYRVNETIPFTVKYISIAESDDITIELDESYISLGDVHSFWYRKENFRINYPGISIKKNFVFRREILANLNKELAKTNEFIHHKLLQKRSLGNKLNVDVNKLVVLDKVQEFGISIPPTLITTAKSNLQPFKNLHKNIISKAISEAILFNDANVGTVFNYTKTLTQETINELNETFALSLFQARIEKKYELRIFYLDGDFYAMAIFSQSDEQTNTDFRRYNIEKPNRTVPYNLPDEIKSKLHLFMKSMNLNTGSIDMAVSLNDEYIFFEVNPVGQFGMTSIPCNYYLDQKIANYLISTNEN